MRSRVDERSRLLALGAVFVIGCGEAEISLSGGAAGAPDPSVNRDWSDGAPMSAGDRIDVGTSDVTFTDPALGDIGHVLAMPGDLDGDGFDDVVIGNVALPGVTHCVGESCVTFRATTVTIVYGAPSMTSDLVGRRATLRAWYGGPVEVAGLGDVNGDGLADMMVSDLGSDCTPGTAVLVYGGPRLSGTVDLRTAGPVLRDDTYCTSFGTPTGLGDVDGDGFDDFAVSAIGAHHVQVTGYVYVFYGSAERWTGRVSAQAAASYRLRTADFHTRFGRGVAAAGDVNGDGLADFTLARTDRDAHLVLGRAERPSGVVTIESIGVPLATQSNLPPVGLGDLDGDGMDELGFPRGNGPLAYFFYGRPEWSPLSAEDDADVRLRAGDGCIVLAAGGDVDGDGRNELLCGAGGHRNGAVAVLLGGEGRLEGEVDLETGSAWILGRALHDGGVDPDVGDGTGQVVFGARDVNGDGLSDILIGAPSPYRGGGVYSGTVHLFLGRRR